MHSGGSDQGLWAERKGPESLGGQCWVRGSLCPCGTEGTLAGMLVQATGLQAVCTEVLYVDCAAYFIFQCLP